MRRIPLLFPTRITLTILAMALILAVSASPAFAHYCTNVAKKPGAGSIGTYDVSNDTFEPSGKKGGGFVTVTDGTDSYEIFAHNTLPEGARNAGPGDNMCDGKGIDDALSCEGIPH